MTNNNPLTDFKEIVDSYQDSPKLGGNIPHSNKNSRCLQCGREISLSRFSPYCSDVCMSNHDKGVKKEIDHKGSDKNVLLGFSKVFEQ